MARVQSSSNFHKVSDKTERAFLSRLMVLAKIRDELVVSRAGINPLLDQLKLIRRQGGEVLVH